MRLVIREFGRTDDPQQRYELYDLRGAITEVRY
jgi:hypothetical protein